MTRLERKEAELAKLYEYRKAAMAQNNYYWMRKNQDKIELLEKEVEECRKYAPQKLSDVLKDEPQATKDGIYKALLRISVLADVVNDACFRCKELLKELGLDDFTLRAEVAEMERVSSKIAAFVLQPKQRLLEDFIVDDDDVVNGCIILADRYLNEKLKL